MNVMSFFFFFFLQWKVAVQRDCLVLCGNQTGIMSEPLISWAFVPLVLKHCKNGMRARRKMFYWIPCCDSVPCVKNLSGLRAVTACLVLFVCLCLFVYFLTVLQDAGYGQMGSCSRICFICHSCCVVYFLMLVFGGMKGYTWVLGRGNSREQMKSTRCWSVRSSALRGDQVFIKLYLTFRALF